MKSKRKRGPAVAPPPARKADAARTPRLRLGAIVAGVLVLAAVAAAVAIWWPTEGPAARPPELDVSTLEPEVAAAVTAARDDVARSPRSASAWGRLGMVLFANGLLEDVGPCLLEARRLDAKDPRWPYLYGLLRKTNSPAEAVPYLEQAADLAGDNHTPRLQLAEVLYELGRLDDAESQYRRVLDRDADNPRAHLGLSRIARDRGDLATARDHLARAAARAPQLRATRELLAQTKSSPGDRQAAERELNRAAQAAEGVSWPDPIAEEMDRLRVGVEASIGRANQLFNSGLQQEAITQMAALVRKYPESASARAALGRWLMALGNLPKAEEMLREATRLDPRRLGALFDLAFTLQRREQYREAADWYRKAIAIQPAYADAHFNLAGCLNFLGDRAGAMEELRTAVRCKPEFARGYVMLSLLLAQEGRRAEALECLQNALRLDPNDQQARALEAQLRGGTPQK